MMYHWKLQYIEKKIEKEYKSESESLSKSEKRYRRIAEENVYNISKDIQDGVYDICMAMQKYYIDDELNALAYDVTHEPFNSDKYKKKIARAIHKLLSNMVGTLKPRINQLLHKLISKYINEWEIKLIEPFWKYDSYPRSAIIHWH